MVSVIRWVKGHLWQNSVLALLSAYSCSVFYVSPNPPSFASSFTSFSTVSLVPASLLGCEAPTLLLPMSGDHFREGKRNSSFQHFRYVRKLRADGENLHFLTCMLHFLSYVVGKCTTDYPVHRMNIDLYRMASYCLKCIHLKQFC